MKLNTDNRDTMPITDAVYGQGRAKPGPAKKERPRRPWGMPDHAIRTLASINSEDQS